MSEGRKPYVGQPPAFFEGESWSFFKGAEVSGREVKSAVFEPHGIRLNLEFDCFFWFNDLNGLFYRVVRGRIPWVAAQVGDEPQLPRETEPETKIERIDFFHYTECYFYADGGDNRLPEETPCFSLVSQAGQRFNQQLDCLHRERRRRYDYPIQRPEEDERFILSREARLREHGVSLKIQQGRFFLVFPNGDYVDLAVDFDLHCRE